MMSRKLSSDEEDAIASLLSVRCRRKQSFKSEDSKVVFDSGSICSDKITAADSDESSNSYPDDPSAQPCQSQHEEKLDPTASKHSAKKTRKPPIKKKMTCQCGAVILVRTQWIHKQSNKHLRFMLRKSQLEAQQKELDSFIPALPLPLPLPLSQQPAQQQQQQQQQQEQPQQEGEGVQQEGSQPPPPQQQLQQQQLQQASLWSQHVIGSIFGQTICDAAYELGQHTPMTQHHGFGGPLFSRHIAQELQALNGFCYSGQLGLDQQLGGWVSNGIESFPSQMPQFPSRLQLWVDRPVGVSSLYGYGYGLGPLRSTSTHHASATAAPPSERQWQCYRYSVPIAPATGFCGRDAVAFF